MKKVFEHPAEPVAGKKYWRSLDELAGTEQFKTWLEREFPQGAAEMTDGVSRREFLKLMGASTALAGFGLAACRRPEKHLVPFTKSVEWAIPGKPLFYTTSMPTRYGAIPLVVATHDGRPTKIEGNPLHPVSKGGTNLFAQASVLGLYDPDRSAQFLSGGAPADAAKFEAFLDEQIKKFSANGGAGLAFLAEESNSPTRERLRAKLEAALPNAKWAVYEPLSHEAARQATAIAFGDGIALAPQVEKADVILALDSDFLGSAEGRIDFVRAFSARRRVDSPKDKLNRLYAVESCFTVTGGMADHRLRVPASHIAGFAAALARTLSGKLGQASLAEMASAFPNQEFTPGWVEELANDLVAAKGRSLVFVGSRQPVVVQVLVAAINSALGNVGATLLAVPQSLKPAAGIGELAKLIADKKVSTLFILGGNPVYNAPADLGWEKLQRSVETVVRLGFHEDETSKAATWHVPAAHYLETWSDGLSADGAYVSVQPMILPLFGGWSELDILARFTGSPKPEGPELVKETFREIAKPALFDSAWNKFLHDGFLAGSAPAPTAPTFAEAKAAEFLRSAKLAAPSSEAEVEVIFAADTKMDDGRYSNNGWLQECPDPITKLTWDNAALISPAMGKKLGLAPDKLSTVERELIEITFADGRKLEIPALVSPGHADHSVTIPLGYGRKVVGRVGKGTGFSAYGLRTSAEPYFASGAKLRATGKAYKLALTQDHHSMEGRGLVREASIGEYEKDPGFAKKVGMDSHIPGSVSIYKHPELTDLNQWGMVVDLSSCIGCMACVVACQAENNIPIVGKEQVINGREMHWMRLDRYFSDEPENPEMVYQPMMCQHCENAPCETVCPVNATVHSEDGLNVMAYNRCIGTRYCANNCPFKVRRFNFFDYNKRSIHDGNLHLGPLGPSGMAEIAKMQKNPNVTVRMRGVMEKCTFCLQRIQEAKIATKVKAGASADVSVPADSFKVACQQACPAEAITFGDTKNPNSKVSKIKANEKNYRLLEYLNVNARVSYLARIRNPNLKMPGADVPEAPHGHGGHA